jgi:Uncharacterized protein conserved in bacteria (DUF2252)
LIEPAASGLLRPRSQFVSNTAKARRRAAREHRLSIVEDTEAYEKWLRTQCKVVEDDLAYKHERMQKHPFVFLRATYYRWARRIEKICSELCDAPSALCVGDIHLENFGTWRDADGRWIWGVNDFDEAAVMPYAFDLVRLTTSANLAPKMKIGGPDAADAILEGYRQGLAKPGPALLDEHEIWIRPYVKCSDECRRKFWKEIDELPPADPDPPAVRTLLVQSLPGKAENDAFFRRVAGGGSLGRPRFVVVATWRGGRVVRECKALVASAWTWVHGKATPQHKFLQLASGLYRAPDPFLQVDRIVDQDFVFRRLSADSRKIDLGKDAGANLKLNLLRGMGADLASIHAATHEASEAIALDVKARGPSWLRSAARAASEATEKDFEVWCRR